MKQGEIWLICLDPTVGAEIKKTRPAVIVNDDSLGKLPLKVIVPLTDWKFNNNNLVKISAADCFQVRSLSEERFVKKVGKISFENIEEIKEALSKVLSIDRL